MGELLEEQKESQIHIKELEEHVAELRLKVNDPSSYLKWNWENVLMWILSLENGRFKSYESVLQHSLSEEDFGGKYLGDVDTADIKGWGIKSFADKKDLVKHIENLVQQNKENVAEPAHSLLDEGGSAQSFERRASAFI